MNVTTENRIRAGNLINGSWREGSGTETFEIRSPFDGELLATLRRASAQEVDEAVAAAVAATKVQLTPFERYEILARTSALIDQRFEEFARTIVAEAGKPIQDARGEVRRAVQTVLLAAEEAKRISGEVIPMDATPGSEHRIGFTLRMPTGPVCAITPFNAPLNQLNHKVPTAFAAGCPVVLKPAENTPLSAIRLVETMIEAGLPPGHVNLVIGGGETVGNQLLADQRFAAYSFTGSTAVGKLIRSKVGLRKTLLELGNSSPNIVHRDADLDRAAAAIAKSGFAFAGQLCISAQRLVLHEEIADEFLALLVARVADLKVGDPGLEETDVGPMINEGAARRAEARIAAAVEQGADLLIGGERDGNLVSPAVLANARPDMELVRNEAFAPVVVALTYSHLGEALELANATSYGLQAAVFTRSLDVAFRVARDAQFGGVMVNEGSHFRIDQMPFGGLKESGVGREGVRYVIDELTDSRLVAFTLDEDADA